MTQRSCYGVKGQITEMSNCIKITQEWFLTPFVICKTQSDIWPCLNRLCDLWRPTCTLHVMACLVSSSVNQFLDSSSVMHWWILTKLGQNHHWPSPHMSYHFDLHMTFDLETGVKNWFWTKIATPPTNNMWWCYGLVSWLDPRWCIWGVHR